jgi:hypothetical protein
LQPETKEKEDEKNHHRTTKKKSFKLGSVKVWTVLMMKRAKKKNSQKNQIETRTTVYYKNCFGFREEKMKKKPEKTQCDNIPFH